MTHPSDQLFEAIVAPQADTRRRRKERAVASVEGGVGRAVLMRRRPRRAPRSGFAGFRFPPDMIMVGVRWYLPLRASYRDVEELLTERGITVDQHESQCGEQTRVVTGSLQLSEGVPH